jgi:hypothetical protein
MLLESSYLRFFGSPSTIMPTSVIMSPAEKEEAALVEWRIGDRLLHVVKAMRVFLLITPGRLE